MRKSIGRSNVYELEIGICEKRYPNHSSLPGQASGQAVPTCTPRVRIRYRRRSASASDDASELPGEQDQPVPLAPGS